jgi:hypothetical protein
LKRRPAAFWSFTAYDSEAVIWARQLVDGHDVELWSGDRFIIKLERHTEE